MTALVRACQAGEVPAEVVLVVSPVDGNPATEAARALGVASVALPPSTPEYADALLRALKDAGAEVVCLAGLMTKLPKAVLDAYPGRVLNVHPALLPRYGGKGMYGLRVHEAVLASGDRESGCTVHVVSEEYDEGPIVLQLKCEVLDGDTPESLASRVLELEHRAYPRALRLLVEGRAERR